MHFTISLRAGIHSQIFDQICLTNMFVQTNLIMCTPNLTFFVLELTWLCLIKQIRSCLLPIWWCLSKKFDKIFDSSNFLIWKWMIIHELAICNSGIFITFINDVTQEYLQFFLMMSLIAKNKYWHPHTSRELVLCVT